MIYVEAALRTIELEVAKLAKVEGPNSKLYARGAMDALAWLVSGQNPPSEGGTSNLPIHSKTDVH